MSPFEYEYLRRFVKARSGLALGANRQAVEQGLEAAGQFAVTGLDAAAGDVTQLATELVHQAEAGDAQPRVEAEDARGDAL